MGMGRNEKSDEENAVSEDEKEAEKQRLNEPEEGIELKKITVRTRDAEYPEIVPGPKKPRFKKSHLKYALLGFNCVLTLLGAVILALAVWIRADPDFWEYKTTLNIDNFYSVCHMFIIAALILLLVAFIGCYGTVAENRWVLVLYVFIFFIIFLMELAAIIMIWSAPYSNAISKQLGKQLKTQIDNRGSAEPSRFFTDFMQKNLRCCGSYNQEDYKDDVPRSCYDPRTIYVYDQGCLDVLLAVLKSKAGIIGGFAIPIVLFHILAMAVACLLIYTMKDESTYGFS